MSKILRNSQRFMAKDCVLAATLVFSTAAHALDPVLSSLGQSGGLTIPSSFVLPQGMFELQGNNYIDPRYGNTATGSQIYWGGVGLLPYVEVTGGLANYSANVPAPFPGADHFIFRHLMANAKVQIPIFFKYQPSIAFGITDVGGQTHFFRSKYGVVSQAFGPLALSLGYGRGDRLDGVFGGAELSLWRTGLSVLVEDDSRTPYAGLRYHSPTISWLAHASVVATLARSLKTTAGASPRTSIAVAVQIPLGQRFAQTKCTNKLCGDSTASLALPPEATNSELIDSNDGSEPNVSKERNAIIPIPLAKPINDVHIAHLPAQKFVDPAITLMQGLDPALPPAVFDNTAVLDKITERLIATGMERIRVGVMKQDLIIEYENHRYNQNEADALGIVLGIAATDAPAGIENLRIVVKKANQPLAEMSISRAAYTEFLAGGSPQKASTSLAMRTRPTYDPATIPWHGDSRQHGLIRIRIQPVTSYVFGTEYSKLDYSVGAKAEAFVPLWRGAELYTSAIAPLWNSNNMDNGRVFSDRRLRGGVSAAALTQSFWIAPQVFNVTALGKFNFHYLGIENETTALVPGRPDLIRLQLAYLRRGPNHDTLPDIKNAALTYRWVQPAWNLWVEGGIARYVGGDKGPLLTLTRWFDDVSFSIYGKHSGSGNFVGASISFPLTPRQGMKPGIVQVSGTEHFSLDFRTRVGATNYINSNAAEELGFSYDTDQNLLNQGRFSADYFTTQLYRMRDAYMRYGQQDAAKVPAPHARATQTQDETLLLSCALNTGMNGGTRQVSQSAGCE